MTPFATIKACWWMWTNALEYVSSHPEYNFMLSCAADGLWGATAEELRKSDFYKALKELLNMENVIVSVASTNISVNSQRVPNENSETVSGGRYNSASVNSEKNNKITVTWYNPAKNNIFLDDLQSRLPIGFPGACKWNIIIPFVSLAGFDDDNLIWSTSSDPTAATSSTLWNFLSILMHNHPGASLEDTNTIMQERYLRPENFKYKDEEGTIKEGGLWYFFKTDEFLKEEVLHEPEVVAALQNTPKSLPSQGGLCYEGPGIQFTIDGSTYDMTEDNRSTLENAVKTEKEIVWSYNSDRARKYGVSESNSITVKVMDRQAHLVPDVSFSIQIN